MDTIKIRHLEFLKTELQFEEKDALHINCYSRARYLHMQIRKVERNIKNEQIKLWNYVLNESISVNNFQLFEDIYRYFDQLNYQIRIMDKIENQNEYNQEEVTRLIKLQQYELAYKERHKKKHLMELVNKRYAENEEQCIGKVIYR